MDTISAILNEGGVPVGIGGDGRELGECDTGRERMFRIGKAVFVANMDVTDGKLEVVDDLGDKRASEGLIPTP